MDENKHYIRLDSENYIVYAFSDAFEQPKQNDICFEEHGGRQLVILGETNPGLFGINGAPLYRYVNGDIIKSEKPMPVPPKVITDSERIEILETALDELMGVVLNG